MRVNQLLLAVYLLVLATCQRDSAGALIPLDYASWSRTTTAILDYPIPGHEDHFRLIYINPVGEGLDVKQEAGRTTHSYPQGTVIVKEIYSERSHRPGDIPAQLTVMIKDSDHPDARGGWLWVVRDVATGQDTVFTGAFCVTCHDNANEEHPYGDRNPEAEFRDYVFFPYLRED